MQLDQASILENATRLLHAMVDVISSNGWLAPALLAMELSQMVSQAIWDSDSPLKQLPHFSNELIQAANKRGVESIWDLMDMEDDERVELLSRQGKLTKGQQMDIAKACNRYPSIDLKYVVANEDNIVAESSVVVNVQLDREREEGTASVHAPLYPKEKQENWWLVIGDLKTRQLLAIKRFVLQKSHKVKLDFNAPSEVGQHNYKLYFMCDSYAGCDQEFEFTLDVGPN